MLQDSFTSADTDMKLRALREEQVEAERIVLATQSALDAYRASLALADTPASARRSPEDDQTLRSLCANRARGGTDRL